MRSQMYVGGNKQLPIKVWMLGIQHFLGSCKTAVGVNYTHMYYGTGVASFETPLELGLLTVIVLSLSLSLCSLPRLPASPL